MIRALLVLFVIFGIVNLSHAKDKRPWSEKATELLSFSESRLNKTMGHSQFVKLAGEVLATDSNGQVDAAEEWQIKRNIIEKAQLNSVDLSAPVKLLYGYSAACGVFTNFYRNPQQGLELTQLLAAGREIDAVKCRGKNAKEYLKSKQDFAAMGGNEAHSKRSLELLNQTSVKQNVINETPFVDGSKSHVLLSPEVQIEFQNGVDVCSDLSVSDIIQQIQWAIRGAQKANSTQVRPYAEASCYMLIKVSPAAKLDASSYQQQLQNLFP